MDKKLHNLIKREIKRQNDSINLIASENYISNEMLDVLGSPLTNKYSEGYPGKRYYPGNKFYDEIENLAKTRGLKSFKLSSNKWAINVQPYSGSPANFAIYSALMKPGDTLMGLNLSSGGHLTHGHKVNFSGKIYKAIQYGTDKNGYINYKEIEKLAKKYKPKVIVSGITAYPRKVNFKKFKKIAKSIGAYHVADISHIAGLVVAGLHESPFNYCDVVMMTTHKTLRGPRGAIIFSKKELSKEIDKAVFPGTQGGPHNNTTAAKALMFFDIHKSSFKSYQKQVVKNSKALAKRLIKFGFNIVTGGTDNHLMLVDLKNIKIGGLEAEEILEKNNIIANRNSIPGDKSPFKPSGLRIGTPAITTRGMKEKDMDRIAKLIYESLVIKRNIKKDIEKLTKKFPLTYDNRW